MKIKDEIIKDFLQNQHNNRQVGHCYQVLSLDPTSPTGCSWKNDTYDYLGNVIGVMKNIEGETIG